MKYIKTYEKKITQEVILNAINYYLQKALPNKFVTKIYNGTLNIREKNLRKISGYLYLGSAFNLSELHICCRTTISSDFVDVFHIPAKIKHTNNPGWNFNDQTIINFNTIYTQDLIDMFNNLPIDELELLFTTEKYNI